MIEIRQMISEGHHSHKEIMDVLGLPQRSFYRYLRQANEHDSKLLEQQNREVLALELSSLKERLTDALHAHDSAFRKEFDSRRTAHTKTKSLSEGFANRPIERWYNEVREVTKTRRGLGKIINLPKSLQI